MAWQGLPRVPAPSARTCSRRVSRTGLASGTSPRPGLPGPLRYPPPALYLFVAFQFIPWPLWWGIPLGVTAYIIWYWRPAPWSWPILAAICCLVAFSAPITSGNTEMWVMMAIALATRWPSASLAPGGQAEPARPDAAIHPATGMVDRAGGRNFSCRCRCCHCGLTGSATCRCIPGSDGAAADLWPPGVAGRPHAAPAHGSLGRAPTGAAEPRTPWRISRQPLRARRSRRVRGERGCRDPWAQPGVGQPGRAPSRSSPWRGRCQNPGGARLNGPRPRPPIPAGPRARPRRRGPRPRSP